jgi:hypothetical protein
MPHLAGLARWKLEKLGQMGPQKRLPRADKPKGVFMKRLAIGNSILVPYVFILAVAVLRLTVNHPYNFVPVFSSLLFFGACRPVREYAMPFLTLMGVDIFLTTHQYGFVLTSGHAVTWLWYLGAMFLGGAILGNSISTAPVLGSSLLASVSFFVASNFTVWAEWGMYPKTLSGLGACYIAALPFFRNSIVSETVCSVLVFTLARYSQRFMPVTSMRRACS